MNRLNKIKWLFGMLFFLGISTTAFAQSVRITGKVVLAGTDDGLPGVSISIKDSGKGTVTDIDGNFRIDVTGNNDVLQFSYIGFIGQNVMVGDRRHMVVALREETLNLEEVVVIGYGTQKKESIVGAISTMGSKELRMSPVSNVTQAIAGKVTGVITNQTQGQPGKDEAQIYIRGIASFTGDGQPLVLVDGVERTFSQIPMDDIEQISILKDASMTAVYGVRGANGVILVTTKRGQEGKPRISFSGNFSLQRPTRIPKFLNSYETVQLLEEAYKNDGMPSQYSADDIELYRQSVGGSLTGDLRYKYPNVDWYDEILNKVAPTQEYAINVTGGTKRMNYFVSASFFDQEGLFKQSGNYDYGKSSNARFKRYSFRANLDFKVTSRFNMAVNMGTRFESRNSPAVNEAWDYSEVFYELNRTPGWMFPIQYPDGRYGGVAFARNNIKAKLDEGGFDEYTNTVSENSFVLEHDLDFITQGLRIKGMVSFDHFNEYRRRFTAGFPTYEYIGGRDGDLDDIDQYIKYGESTPLTMDRNDQVTRMKTYLEFALNYDRTFSRTHNITGLFLYNQSNYEYMADLPRRYQGVVARGTYNYDKRYFLEANFAYNGSENFAKGNRFGFFPSVSGGWILTNEQFMEGTSSWLDYMKLRASYGEVGNDKYHEERFLYISQWQLGGGYIFGGSHFQGIYEGTTPNLHVTWERAQKYDIGFESFSKDRLIGLNVDVFYENRKNILTSPLTVESATGVVPNLQNLGRAINRGIEIELKHSNTVGSSVNYFANASFAVVKNRIEDMGEPPYMPGYAKQEGNRIRQYYGFVAEGFFTSQEEIDNSIQLLGSTPQIGDLKFKDLNNDGIIDERDKTAIGYSDIPEQVFSLNLGCDYRNFSLNVLFQGVNNVSRYYSAETMYEFFNGGKVSEHHRDRWDPSQSVEYNMAHAKYPLLHYQNQQNNHNVNSFFVQNGAYIRLKNVEVAYTLPKKISHRAYMENVRFYINGNNLITWDKLMNNLDPEMNGVANVYPIMSVYNVGVNIQF